MRTVIVALALLTAACSGGSRSATSPTTTRNVSAISPATRPTCPAPPVTLPTGGQTVVPVAVPCGCPTQSIVPIPEIDAARTGPVADTALRWIRHVNPAWLSAGKVSSVYVVGETSTGQFGDVFALNVPKYCGRGVAGASYVVEMQNPTENDTGREADVVVAHFAKGWQVWGSFHP
jgi:hypothetical protein